MDQRVIVTAVFAIHLLVGGLFALAYITVDPVFDEGQGEFVLIVGYLAPIISLGLLWAKNYRFGAPFLTLCGGATAWFVGYLFVIHDNQASVFSVTGEGSIAYGAAIFALMITSFGLAIVGFWIWYRTNEAVKQFVDSVRNTGESTS